MAFDKEWEKINDLLAQTSSSTEDLASYNTNSSKNLVSRQKLMLARKYTASVIENLLNFKKIKLRENKLISNDKKHLQKYKTPIMPQENIVNRPAPFRRSLSLSNLNLLNSKNLKIPSNEKGSFSTLNDSTFNDSTLNDSKLLLSDNGVNILSVLISKDSETVVVFFTDSVKIYSKAYGTWKKRSTMHMKSVLFSEWVSENEVIVFQSTPENLYSSLFTLDIKTLKIETIQENLNFCKSNEIQVVKLVGNHLVVYYLRDNLAFIKISNNYDSILAISTTSIMLETNSENVPRFQIVRIMNTDNLVALVYQKKMQIFDISNLQKSSIFDFGTVGDDFSHVRLFTVSAIAKLSVNDQINPGSFFDHISLCAATENAIYYFVTEGSSLVLLRQIRLPSIAIDLYSDISCESPYIAIKRLKNEISLVDRFTGSDICTASCDNELRFLASSRHVFVVSSNTTLYIYNL